MREPERVTQRGLAGRMLMHQPHGSFVVFAADFNPLPMHANKRRAMAGQLFKVIAAERVIADGNLPLELDDRVKPERRAGCAAERCAAVVVVARWRNMQPRTKPARASTPPAGHDHINAGLCKDRPNLTEQLVRLGCVQRE